MAWSADWPDPTDINATVRQFDEWLFPHDVDLSSLQHLALQRLGRTALRYVVADSRWMHYVETGIVLKGNSQSTGLSEDDGAVVVVQLRRRPNPYFDDFDSTDLAITVDDGSSIEQIGLYGRQDGWRDVRSGRVWTPQSKRSRSRADNKVRNQIMGGSFVGAVAVLRPRPLAEDRLRTRVAQLERIIGKCAIDADATKKYANPNRPY